MFPMRVLVIVPHYPPEIGSAAHLYHDLARRLAARGHRVGVLTSYPRDYNVAGEGSPVLQYEVSEGVEIYRCNIDSKRDNIILRGMEHFLMPLKFYGRFLAIRKRYDVSLIYVPPLPLALLGMVISRVHGMPVVANFQDFHPQELIEGGLMKEGAMVRFYEWMEKVAYRGSDHISVLSEGGVAYIKAKSAREEGITHIYNSVDITEIDRYRNKKDFKERNGFGSSFLISYLGILSPFQGLDILLDAAKKMNDRDVVFLIAGDGLQRQGLLERIERESIGNVRMMEMQPRDEYYNILNSSDLALIVLDQRMKAPLIPGKTVNIMACGKPVLAIVPEESETARVITVAECGLVSEPSDIEDIVKNLLLLKNDPHMRERMGRNGREFVENNMDLDKNLQRYEEIFNEGLKRRGLVDPGRARD